MYSKNQVCEEGFAGQPTVESIEIIDFGNLLEKT